MSDQSAIEAHDLRKAYPPGVQALDGLSLSVRPGTIFGLLGPNGAGKSATVRILTTLSRPDSGAARVAGIDVLAEPMRVRRAMASSPRSGLDPEATGRENLVLQGEFHAITGRDLRGRVSQALERFGLADAADRQAKTYSGGSSAGSTWPWDSSTARSCSSTSRPPGWTPRRGPSSGTRSSAWRAKSS